MAASLGAAASLPLAACSTSAGNRGVEFSQPNLTPGISARNVRDYGAVGDGDTDDTDAIARSLEADDGPIAVYFPAGIYLVTSWPEIPDYSTIFGAGSVATTIVYEGDETLIALHNHHRVSFKDLGFYTTGTRSIAISLSACFRCSFESVVFRGNHLSDNYPEYIDQRGIVLDENTGGTVFINCDINNFGVGLTTSCIQNYITSSKLASNYIGVLGTGNNFNAGMSITNAEFVSDRDPHTTDKHIYIDGSANDWWLTNVWFEGADTAISVGARGRGGPAQFGLVNCKVAARNVCVDLIHCRQPYLANVALDPDSDAPPIELRIDDEGCPDGTAVNLISSSSADIDPGVFPAGWNVTGRGRVSGPRFTGAVVTRARDSNADLLQAQEADGSVVSAVLPSGAWLSDRADSGVILKAPNGRYWRLTVSDSGDLRTTPLGSGRPKE